MRFERGDAVSPLMVTGDAPRRENGEFLTGTHVTFMPSISTFAHIDFDLKTWSIGSRAGLSELRRGDQAARPARRRTIRGDPVL